MANKKESMEISSNQKRLALIVLLAVVVVIIFLFVAGNKEAAEGENEDQNNSDDNVQISGLELVKNKEKYENVQVTLMNILVSDPLFAYVEFEEGGGERLFIQPKKSDYCLHFNLEGKLQKDEVREWMFYVSNFECVSNN